jgi:hypothetical protein
MKATEIAAEAARIVGGDRARTHGDKTTNHTNIATLWSAYLGVPITATQAAVMMVLLKAARTKAGAFNPDDYVDMVGYAACAGEIAHEAEARYKLCGVGVTGNNRPNVTGNNRPIGLDVAWNK